MAAFFTTCLPGVYGTTAESGLTATTRGGHSCRHSAAAVPVVSTSTMAMYWQHRIVKFDMKKE